MGTKNNILVLIIEPDTKQELHRCLWNKWQLEAHSVS